MAKLRDELIQRLAPLGVEHRPMPGRDDGFASLFYRDKPFAHFHNDNELDLRLTKKVIRELEMSHPPDSVNHPGRSPNSPWIEVRFNQADDIEKVSALVQRAVAAL